MSKKPKMLTITADQPTSLSGYHTIEDMNKLLAETSDAELGRMYRQRKEAQEFLQARGLY